MEKPTNRPKNTSGEGKEETEHEFPHPGPPPEAEVPQFDDAAPDLYAGHQPKASTDWKAQGKIDIISDDLDFRCEIARRYHVKFAGFYEAINRLTLTLTIIGGTAFFTDSVSDNNILRTTFAGMISTFGIFHLVFGCSQSADHHRAQYRRYSNLLIDPTLDAPEKLRTAMIRIETDEGYSVRKNLYAICQNEVAYVRGRKNSFIPLRWWQKVWVLVYLVDLPTRPKQ